MAGWTLADVAAQKGFSLDMLIQKIEREIKQIVSD